MDLKNKLLRSIVFCTLSISLGVKAQSTEAPATDTNFVKDQLVELLAKQATNNLRFITNDGKLLITKNVRGNC